MHTQLINSSLSFSLRLHVPHIYIYIYIYIYTGYKSPVYVGIWMKLNFILRIGLYQIRVAVGFKQRKYR